MSVYGKVEQSRLAIFLSQPCSYENMRLLIINELRISNVGITYI